MLFISAALAQDALPATAPNSTLMSFLPLVLIFAVFYFVLIRPQMKKQKEHLAMINSIARGEKVVTGGGIIGTVTKVEEDDSNILHVEIAPDVRIKVLKSTITDVLSRTQPVKQDNAPPADVKATKKK
jgi:preprotein translocase subunit YajC